MGSLANEDVRRMARCADVPQWKIAKELGISEPRLCRWLGFELSDEKKHRIVRAIQCLSEVESA